MFGETAMTFLQVRLKPFTNGKERETVLRLTHTWREKDGEWGIVGGKSCNVSPDGTC
jgi:ketosteroid isomerase-like protein